MAQKIHYRDDLFVLSSLTRAFAASLAVEADPEFFRERLSGDLFFLDASIRAFKDLLVQNSHLIERAEYLKLLEGISTAFLEALESLLRGESPTAEAYGSLEAQVRGVVEAQRSIRAAIRAILEEGSEAGSDSDLVSEDELSELLRG